MTKLVRIFLGLIKLQLCKLKLGKIRAYKYVFKIRKAILIKLYLQAKNQIFLLVEQFLKRQL